MSPRCNQVAKLLNQYIDCNAGQETLRRFIVPISRGFAHITCIDKYNIRVCTYHADGELNGRITFDDIEHAALFLVNLDIDLTQVTEIQNNIF